MKAFDLRWDVGEVVLVCIAVWIKGATKKYAFVQKISGTTVCEIQ